MTQSQIRLLDITNNIIYGLKQIFIKWLMMSMDYLSDEEIDKITGINIPEAKVKETMKLKQKFQVDQLPQDTQNKVMMLIMQEVEDIFNKKDIKYDIDIKVGTDGLTQIKIQQINMLMQQLAPLSQTGAVPPDAIKGLLSKLCELMEFPQLAKTIKEYQPQPDPMQQQMAQLQMAQMKANVDKESSLAQANIARAKATEIKAQKEAVSTEADIAQKYANVTKTLKEANENKNTNDGKSTKK